MGPGVPPRISHKNLPASLAFDLLKMRGRTKQLRRNLVDPAELTGEGGFKGDGFDAGDFHSDKL